MFDPKDDYDYKETLSEELEEAEENMRQERYEDENDDTALETNAPNVTNDPGEDS